MLERRLIVVLRRTADNPTNVRPPATVARCMGIPRAIRVRVMHPMCCNPLYRSTLEGQRATCHQKIFHWFRYFVTTVSKQPMIAHADTQATGNPVKNDAGYYCLPAEEKKRDHGTGVENR